MKITDNLKRVSYASMLLVVFYVVKMLFSICLRSSIANFFGAAGITDAYFAALTIPQLFGDFLIGGIIFSLIIPVFQQREEDVGERKAFEDVAGLLNLSALGLLVLTVVYFLLIPFIIPVMFPGFKGETLSNALELSRWFSPCMLLMGMSLIYAAFYHAHRDFLTPCVSMLCYPVISLASLWLLPSKWGIERLIIANVAGYVAGLFILILFINRKIQWRWNWNFKNPLILTTLLLAWPLLIANTFGKIMPIVQKSASSCLPRGNLTLLDNALWVTSAVLMITSGPIATAVFPLFGEQKAKAKNKLLFETFNKALNVMLFISIPLTVLLFAQSWNIVDFVYGYGKLAQNNEAKLVCSNLIIITSLGIIPVTLSHIILKYFLVHQETLGFSILGIVTTVIVVPLYYFTSTIYEIASIAVIAKFVLIFLEIVYLKIRHKYFSLRALFFGIIKLLIAGAVMFFVVFSTALLIADIPFAFIRLVACSGTGWIVYIIVVYLLKVEEFQFLATRIPFAGSFLEKHFNMKKNDL